MPTGPFLAPATVSGLRERLAAAGYTVDSVAEAIGPAGQAGLGRNSTLPAARALGDRTDALATLTRLFVLQLPQSTTAVAAALGDLAQLAGLVAVDAETATALVDVRPYGSPDDDASGWLVSDLTPGLDGRVDRMRPDYVLGASPASRTLSEMTVRRPVAAALDLGTGCGVQALHLARHAARVVATDLNPRALQLADLTFALDDVRVEPRLGSLFEPVADERFDLIVTNPPYVMAPPAPERERLTYREGGLAGDELVRRVVSEGARHLNPGGVLQVLANWAYTGSAERPTHLVSSLSDGGFDALVTERERLDPYAYIELWLADAGLAADPDPDGEYRRRYDAWLAWFGDLDILQIGMGWIWVRRWPADAPATRRPSILLETHYDAIAQPVGPLYAAYADALDALAGDDDGFLAAPYAIAPGVREERIHAPGAEDPQHIVFRSSTGFLPFLLADSETAATLGACDGELPLGAIVDAVASLTGAPAPDLRERLTPLLREAVRRGLLRRA